MRQMSEERARIWQSLLAATVALGTVAASWLVRRWVERELDHGLPVSVLGDLFRLTRGENTGMAFGFLRDSPLAAWLPILALVAVLAFLWRGIWARPGGALAGGLVLGGGLANLLDRLPDGAVTDYLDWGIGTRRYATFNLPDSAIVVGMALVVWLSLRPPR